MRKPYVGYATPVQPTAWHRRLVNDDVSGAGATVHGGTGRRVSSSVALRSAFGFHCLELVEGIVGRVGLVGVGV